MYKCRCSICGNYLTVKQDEDELIVEPCETCTSESLPYILKNKFDNLNKELVMDYGVVDTSYGYVTSQIIRFTPDRKIIKVIFYGDPNYQDKSLDEDFEDKEYKEYYYQFFYDYLIKNDVDNEVATKIVKTFNETF